jgi:uncharacterized protein (DUF486 family)
MSTIATPQLQNILNIYTKILPLKTFPFIPFIIAAFFQSLAWMSGPIFLSKYTLGPRMFILILFAAGEYLFMSPAMNAGVEIFNMTESYLVITYHIITLLVFIFVNIFIFKKKFEIKYLFAFIFAGLAVYMANKE